MKRGLKYISFFLSLCLMFTLFSGFTNAEIITAVEDIQENIVAEEAVSPEFVEDTTVEYLEETAFPEIISKEEIAENKYVGRVKEEEKNEYTLVLRNADGSNTLRLFDYPVKYTDATGQQKDISLDLEKRLDGGYQTAANSIKTTFPQKLSDGISLEYEDVAVRMVPMKHSEVATTMQTTSLAVDSPSVITATAALSTDRKMVSYQYDSQTALEYSLTYTGFKEDIVVEEYTGQTEYTFRLYTNGLTLVEEDGSYYLADATGKIKATIGDIIIFTADERNNTFGSMTYETVEANEEYILIIHVDAAYLKDEKTVYPIRIDPTLEINYDNNGSGAIQDVTINSLQGSSGSSGSLMIGKRETYGISRVLMKFPGLNLSSFLSADQIKSAAVEIRDLMCESEVMDVYCYPFTGNTWVESTANWSNVSPNSYSTSTYSYRTVSYAHGNNMTDKHCYRFTITQAVKGWKSGTYSQSKGIIFKATSSVENGGTYLYKTFASYNRSSNKPSLIVTYTPIITLSATSTSLNVGKTVTLKVSTYPAMTVSWSSSNSSIATVSSTGIVTGKKLGSTVITAKGVDSSGNTCSATCRVYVTIENGVYCIKNSYSNLYLHVQSGKITNKTNVYQYSKQNTEPVNLRQMWKIYHLGSGYYSVRPMHKLNMGLYLDGSNVCINNINTIDSASAVTSSAMWSIEESADGYIIKHCGSNSALLSLEADSTAITTNVEIQKNGGYQRQKWILEKVSNPPEGALLYNTETGLRITSVTKYMAVGETVSLTDLQLEAAVYSGTDISQGVSWYTKNEEFVDINSEKETFTGVFPGKVTVKGYTQFGEVEFTLVILPLANGTYYIKNLFSNRYMDILDATGTLIGDLETNSANASKWIFTHHANGYYTIKLANQSSNYYFGVKNDSTVSGTEMVLRSGTVTAGMLWKIEVTSSGGYKLTPKSGESAGMALGTSSVFVWQTQYQDDRDYADEWWISTQPQYHAFVFNYYDKGYLVRYEEDEKQARAAIDSYTDAVAQRFKDLFGLIIISPPASYYNSPMDECKGSVTESNIDTLCQHLIKHTTRDNLKIDFLISMPESNQITSVLWTGHRVTSTSASGAPENNRSISDGSIVLMLEIPLGHMRDQSFTGTLMHELCHQYDGKDHYHEESTEDNPKTCVNKAICSECDENPRPKTCIMYHSEIDISANTVLCKDCQKEILTHLQAHH